MNEFEKLERRALTRGGKVKGMVFPGPLSWEAFHRRHVERKTAFDEKLAELPSPFLELLCFLLEEECPQDIRDEVLSKIRSVLAGGSE
jgi:hypothetical protein